MPDVLGRPVGHVVQPEDRQSIVTDWSGYNDYINAPPDYGTFYKQYYEYIRHLVSKFGVSELDDVTADIIQRFIERDSIGVFSNEWGSRSKTGRSGFRSYLSRFVVTYARGKQRNVLRHHNKERRIMDAPVGDGSTTFGELQETTTNLSSNIEFEDLVGQLRVSTEREETGAETLNALLEMVLSGSQPTAAAVARQLGCTPAKARAQLAGLADLVPVSYVPAR